MKILHYFLGFPPYRSGGLTKYAWDLMQAQASRGDRVYALWPGRMGSKRGKLRIRRKQLPSGIVSCELCNPLPVPLDEGIWDTAAFMQPCDGSVYRSFLETLRPKVIHIHTLMGLHREFLEAAQALSIPTVYTSHDYFGLCPKVNLYCREDACQRDQACQNCIACNTQALSLKTIRLLQSGLYRFLKDSRPVRLLRKLHRNAFFSEVPPSPPALSPRQLQEKAGDYRELRAYYLDMLSRIDRIHFNSTLSQQIFSRYFTPKDGRVLSITHKGIADHRDAPHTEAPLLRLTCLAPAKPYKGYSVIRQALDELWDSGFQDFTLQMFSPVPAPAPYLQVRPEGFSSDELGQIFSRTDVLLAPSIWYETFGFTVLEALSYGVPVIISDRVGAGDIAAGGAVVIPAGSVQALKDAITGLDLQKRQQLRSQIRTQVSIRTWDAFLSENDRLYE